MSIKFVRVLNDQGRTYDSYTDYYRLVELSGFETCEQDALDRDSDTTYIFPLNNGNMIEAAKVPRSPRCRFICHQLERPVHGYEGFAPPHYDEVWVSDRWLASQLKDDPRVKYIPIGGHPGLGGQRAPNGFIWDITHQCYRYGRRDYKIACLEMHYKVGPACWGAERDEQLASSRVGVCFHQENRPEPLPIIEPLRMTLFSCWKIPLVADFSHDYYPYVTHPVADLPALMGDGSTGEQNYHLLTETLTFRKCVEAML